MARITVHVEGRYEIHETPFARTYKWYPAHVILGCDCGEELTLIDASSTTICGGCGADHNAVVLDFLIQDVQEREALLRDEVTRPWRHDTQAQKDQNVRDEAAYPNGSPWRYNDISDR